MKEDKKALPENRVRSEGKMPHLLLAALIVIICAAAAQKAVFTAASYPVVLASVAAIWLIYSAAIAKFMARGGFSHAFKKTLALDSFTYLPLLLPLIAKVALAGAGSSLAKYPGFENLPVMLALGIGISASIAWKIMLLPKQIDNILDWYAHKKKIKMALAAAVIIYFAFFSAITVMRHNSFNSTAYDLAIFDQTIWGYSNGELLVNTVRGINLLGDHMHPILFLIAPLYKIFPMPEALLVLQSLALALGALPIFWIARKKINTAAAAMIALSYLLYPSLQYINLFDFHPEAFAIPLLLFAIYFIEEKKYAAATAMLVLTGLCKEHFPLVMASLGAYVFIAHKKRKLGAAMAIAGIAWFAINFKFLLPHFYGEAAYAHLRGYEYLGNTIIEAASNAVLHPQLVIGKIIALDTLAYAALLLIPLGAALAVLLGAPYLLLAAPFLAINFLRSQDLTTAVLYQHNAELIPFIYFAAIMGANRMAKLLSALKLNNKKTAAGAFIIMTTLAAAAAYGPFATIYDAKDFIPDNHSRIGHELHSEVPKDASVSADPLMLPHLAHRKEAYMFPNPFITFMYGKEYWKLENGTKEGQSKVDYVLLDLSRASPSYSAELYTSFVAEFVNNRNYGLDKLEDGYAVFRKGGNYGSGLCRLSGYFKSPVNAAVRIDLNNALSDENRALLKRCVGEGVQQP